MTPTNEQRKNRYREASESVRELYADENVGQELSRVFESYHIRPELYIEYALAFGDVVLDFEKKENLAKLLTERVGLPEKLAGLIAHDLTTYLDAHTTSVSTERGSRAASISSAPTKPVITASTSTVATSPAWTTAPKTPPPTAEAPTPEEKPFYPRVPNYSKPYTSPTAPPAPFLKESAASLAHKPPEPSTHTPKGNDPYHEPI